jgi:hypothetical protein
LGIIIEESKSDGRLREYIEVRKFSRDQYGRLREYVELRMGSAQYIEEGIEEWPLYTRLVHASLS